MFGSNCDDIADVSVGVDGDRNGEVRKRENQICDLKVNNVDVEISGTEYGKVAWTANETVHQCADLVKTKVKRGRWMGSRVVTVMGVKWKVPRGL